MEGDRMKKTVFPFILMIVIAITACAQQHDPESDFEVSPRDGGKSVVITKYVGSKWTVRIPPKIKGLPVTHIGAAFDGYKNLTSVTIPDSVTNIGGRAFTGCTNLTSITIPSSVTSIEIWAFGNCDSLDTINVTVGNNAYTTENGALYNKDKTSLHTYPKGKKDISFNIPNSVTSIGDWAFAGCTSLASVNIPDRVTTIGVGTFLGCTNLTSVTIPNSVISIQERAFEGCTSLASVTFQGTISSENFGGIAFSGGLRDMYLAGGIGTYTRENPYMWKKQ
jgi:hypothetical protein